MKNLFTKLSLLAIICVLSFGVNAQLVINEFDTSTNTVEFKNIGNSMVNASGYLLCTFPTYVALADMEPTGSLMVMPGAIFTVSSYDLDAVDGELGLYISGPFSDFENIIDYVEWGEAGHSRADEAADAGIWTEGQFISAPADGNSAAWDASGDGPESWIEGAPTFGEENFPGGCEVVASVISTESATEICAGDGVSDAITVDVVAGTGSNTAWVITDEAGEILGLPESNEIDLEGAGAGICLIWQVTFEDLTGAEVGMNANDLEGCFELSNSIAVTRTGVAGGTISTDDPLEICAGDGVADPINVTLEGAEGTNSAWVITDESGQILGLPEGSPFDLEGAGEGTCLIWHLSFEDGLVGAEVDMNANELVGCYALSNPITVVRTGVVGGTISTEDALEICAGDGVEDPINLTLEGNEGTNSGWVITNEAGEILGLPESNVIDLEGAGEGTCLIWHISFEDGLTGAEVGMNTSDLDGCFALSNSIAVVRTGVSGGTISTEDATAICPGDGIPDPINVTLEGAEGTNSAWVITDEAGLILGLPEGPVFDLDEAGVGVCLIWHLSFEDGLVGAEVDLNANDLEGCFSLSNPITVVRSTPEAAVISTLDALEICAGDGVEDPITVTVDGGDAANTAWVITNEAGEILGLPESNVIDLEGAGEGVCLIWYLSYNNVEGAEIGMNANDLTGCFALSNSISVTRTGVAGGTITTEDPTTICVDGVADPINVTLEGNEGTNSAWVITDEAGEILDLPVGSPFDLDGAGPGVCLLWHLSFEDGLTGAEVGMNAADLDGCFSLSNSITVTRAEPVAGTISTTDTTEICVGDGVADPITVDVDGAVGPNFAWVITDEAGEILGLPETNVIDLEGAGEGVCLIWYVSYGTLEGAEVGMNANDLTGCFVLSNSISVTRTGVDAGMVTTDADETTITVVVGDGDADVITFANTSESDASYVYVITDDSNVIIGSTTDSNDFEGAEAGTCLVWGVSYTGEITITEGESLNDLVSDGCSVITEEPVTVIREAFNSVLESDQSSTYLFPSAGNGVVTLVTSLNNPQIEVYSNFGQLVMQNRLNSSTSTLDFSNLASGNYVIRVIGATNIDTLRFVKTK